MAHSLQNTRSVTNESNRSRPFSLGSSSSQNQTLRSVAALAGMILLALWSWSADSLFLDELLVVGGIFAMVVLVCAMEDQSKVTRNKIR